MAVIALVCVVGLLGSVTSARVYDELYGQHATGVREVPPSIRSGRSRRQSRQLRAVGAALDSDDGSPLG